MNLHKAQKAAIVWRNGDPFSEVYADSYYSQEDGLAESQHVFLGGNNLPAAYKAGFHIAELGFGTGLNLLAAWQAWSGPGPLNFTSFELHPMDLSDLEKALAAWPVLQDKAEILLAANGSSFACDSLTFNLVVGDARETVPNWAGKADAWFLDGFSPAQNPAMWDADLLTAVAQKTVKGGSVATYSAAGHVRRKLTQAGFAMSRRPGFGRKRHMISGVLKSGPTAPL